MPHADESLFVDNLIVGSGIAGLMLALRLAERAPVVIVTKGALVESNSVLAQGGIATVLGKDDSFEQHIHDTLVAGAGLCRKDIVSMVVESGPNIIERLVTLGVSFDTVAAHESADEFEEPAFHLTREGGHSQRRVMHHRDRTGHAIMDALRRAVLRNPNIRVLEHHFAVDLITTDKVQPSFTANRCVGAYILRRKDQRIFTIRSVKTFLCTGGQGRVYLYTSNPRVATGDGLAMAWRAGCKVANLEFMQFHPTCLFHPENRSFLISEALRGEGGVLKDAQGLAFMDKYDVRGSLAPRDIVARAIDAELKKTGATNAFLDVRHLGADAIRRLFPTIYQTCAALGLDITEHMIPVVPAAHYSCGGVATDADARTDVGFLWALGEVACSGLHGANRLASNSLLEACVFAERAAASAFTESDRHLSVEIPPWDKGQAIPADEQVILSHTWDEIRRLMWNYVGIMRSDNRLKRALDRIVAIRRELDDYYWEYEVNESLLEVRNLAEVAWLTIRCAIARKESRGIHFNIDYPDTEPSLCRDTIIR